MYTKLFVVVVVWGRKRTISTLCAIWFVACGGVEAIAADSPSVSPELRNQAVQVMRDHLSGDHWSSRIRAAEFLLKLDYPQGVVNSLSDATTAHDRSHDRIDLWRVMALASFDEATRAAWVDHLRDAMLDVDAPDRESAAAALIELGYSPTADDIAQLRQRGLEGKLFAGLLVAKSDQLTSDQLLVAALESEDLRDVAAAARYLSNSPPASSSVLAAVSSALDRQRSNSLAREGLIVAASRGVDGAPRKSLVAPLRAQLHTADEDSRSRACAALAIVGTDEDVPELTELLAREDADSSVTAAYAICRIERRKGHHLGALDWLMIGGYAVAMLAIGLYYARRTSNAEEYLLGGRNISSWQAGLSLFASLLSTVTYLAIPGEMIKHGPMFLASILSAPVVMLIVGWLVIPFIMRMHVTSAYEILEGSLGLGVRMLGSVYFLLIRLVWMAVIIYATTDKVLVPVLDVDPSVAPWISVVLGVLTVIYTTMGGLRAVVVSDVIQSFILFGGALLSLLMISMQLGGAEDWWPTVWEAHWDKPALWFDPEARITVAAAIMSAGLWWICTASSDQVAVQRYLATRDVKAARGALISAQIAGPIVTVTLGILGFALLAFYQSNPHMVPDGKRVFGDSDQLFAHYIVLGLPAGVSGLVVAGLLAAAMSSLSSGVNSTGTVVIVDFVERFRRAAVNEAARVKLAKWSSVVVGVVVIVLSLSVGRIEGNLLELANKLSNLLVVPLFVLFFMAMLIPWATPFGAVAGSFASLGMSVATAYFEVWNLNFMWMMPAAFATGIVVGPLASLLPIGRRSVPPERN